VGGGCVGGGSVGGGCVGGGSVGGGCELELCDPHPASAMHNPKVRTRTSDPTNIERHPLIDSVFDTIGIPHSLR
jgi:hypothetical protein